MGRKEIERPIRGEKSERFVRKILLSSSFLIQVSSRDSLWRRVVEMSKGSVDLINAHTGKELPQAFKTAGLNENSV